ncbi:hypothetical protein LAT59_01765 [Candidatus Gracilibacteria bacterium]|nr:hypothetical protein [Candidatus Gracilibacteria bacterium]
MYTKALSFGVLFLLSLTSVFAGEETKNTSSNTKTQQTLSHNFNMSTDYRDGQIHLKWTAYDDKRNFKWYKLAFSKENSQPSYPQNDGHFIGDDASQSSYSFWPNTRDFIYINLCVVMLDDTIYCDRGVKVLLTDTDVKKNTSDKVAEEYKKDDTKDNTEDKKAAEERLKKLREDAAKKNQEEKVKTDEKKEVIYKDEVGKTQMETRLSANLQKRADLIIDTFILRLEAQNLSSAAIVSSIDLVQERLGKLASQLRYRQLVGYMIEKLEAYKQEFELGLSEIEAIFNSIR